MLTQAHMLSALHIMAPYNARGTAVAVRAGMTSTTWGTANRATYIPFECDRPRVITQGWVRNGSAAANGNWDLGIYTADGRLLVSCGSTAQVTPDAYQLVTLAKRLDRGVYYFAIVADSASTSFYQQTSGSTGDTKAWGILNQTSAFALPSQATFATNTVTTIPLAGLTGRAV